MGQRRWHEATGTDPYGPASLQMHEVGIGFLKRSISCQESICLDGGAVKVQPGLFGLRINSRLFLHLL